MVVQTPMFLRLHALHCGGPKPVPLKIHAKEEALDLVRRTAEGLPWCEEKFGSACEVEGTSLCSSGSEAPSQSWSIPMLFLRMASQRCEGSDIAVIAAVSRSCCSESEEADAWLLLCSADSLQEVVLQLGRAGCVREDFQEACALEGVLGHGSFATVCAGHMVDSNQNVAAKRMAEIVHVDRVQREVAMHIACHSHKHVIGIIGIFHEQIADGRFGRWTLVLERAAGGDLFDHIRQVNHMGEFDAWYIFRGLMLALEHLHGLDDPIVHRDVKAENVLVTVNGEAQLTDFGFACHLSDTDEMRRQCGSPGCTAPELLNGQPYNCKVDVFGAGCVLYYMLIGKMPFVASDVASTLRRNEKCQFDFSDRTVLERWEIAGTHLKDLLQKLLQPDADSRLQAAEALHSPWLLHVPSHSLSLKQRHLQVAATKHKRRIRAIA